MAFKKVLEQLNIAGQCRKYGLPLWQCPQFLFVVMGIVIMIASIVTYSIGIRYVIDPQLVVLIVLALTTILFVIAFIITRSFEKLAEVARMKSEFIDIVSHQLRAPLTNLKWALSFMSSGEAGEVSERQIEYFKILSENTERMGELVEDLLTISKIEQGKMLVVKKEVFLEEIVKATISEFEPLAKASNVEVTLDAQENIPNVSADSHQISIVIENLLSNAIHYTRTSGKIAMKIAKKGDSLYFEIKDTGMGISQEDQKYIFQKFFRARNVIKHQTQGSGLGLFICKSIIKKSDGEIGFVSEENKGSTFWFTLPIFKK